MSSRWGDLSQTTLDRATIGVGAAAAVLVAIVSAGAVVVGWSASEHGDLSARIYDNERTMHAMQQTQALIAQVQAQQAETTRDVQQIARSGRETMIRIESKVDEIDRRLEKTERLREGGG